MTTAREGMIIAGLGLVWKRWPGRRFASYFAVQRKPLSAASLPCEDARRVDGQNALV